MSNYRLKALRKHFGLSKEQARTAEKMDSFSVLNGKLLPFTIDHRPGFATVGIIFEDLFFAISVPLKFIDKPPSWIVYNVAVSPLAEKAIAANVDQNKYFSQYVGITTRGLPVRMKEHMQEALSGSMVRFKRYLRGEYGKLLQSGKLRERSPTAMVTVQSYGYGDPAEGYAVEERNIRKALASAGEQRFHEQGGMVLNTALTSFDFQRRVRGITGRTVPLENAEEEHSRLVWAGKSWMGDVSRTIGTVCNNPHNFSVDDVELISMLRFEGYSRSEAASIMNCSERRLLNLVARKTYRFLDWVSLPQEPWLAESRVH